MNIVSRFTIEKSSKYQNDMEFRRSINFVLTFLSVIIFGVFAIRPSITTITGLIKDLDEYRKINGILIEKIAILNDVSASPERLEKEGELISRALPESPDEGSYIRNVNFIASKNKVQILSMVFTVTEEEGLGSLGFNLSIQGPYQQIIEFIADFNKLLRVTNIETVDISPEGENLVSIKASIIGKAYFLERK